MLNKKRMARRAFTLVEILLVLAILATLAAIVIPRFAGRTKQARETAAKSQISIFGTAIDSFEVDTGEYPKGSDGLQALMTQPKDASNWRGPYLKQAIPLDPWGNAYVYENPGKHNEDSYDVYSLGPDGKSGNEDDVTNWTATN